MAPSQTPPNDVTGLLRADADYAVALDIVGTATRTFARLARIAAERTGLATHEEPVPMVLGGSVLSASHPVDFLLT